MVCGEISVLNCVKSLPFDIRFSLYLASQAGSVRPDDEVIDIAVAGSDTPADTQAVVSIVTSAGGQTRRPRG